MKQPRQMAILVGGIGSRLGTLVRHTPKPMLEINGQPFLMHLIDWFARFGFERFLLLAGYKAETLADYFQQFPPPQGVKVDILSENSPLGTGGALKAAGDYLEDIFVVSNGDSICLFNTAAFYENLMRPSSLAKMAVRKNDIGNRYGQITQENGLISGFQERAVNTGKPGLMNIGLYLMKKDILNFLPAGPHSLEKDIFPKLAYEKKLESCEVDEKSFFIDIGVPEDFNMAQALLCKKISEACYDYNQNTI